LYLAIFLSCYIERLPPSARKFTACLLQQTYKIDFVMNLGIVRFGLIKQALQKPELEFKLTPDRIPASTLTVAAGKFGIRAETLVLSQHSVKGLYSHV
jgi:hypothetical protein